MAKAYPARQSVPRWSPWARSQLPRQNKGAAGQEDNGALQVIPGSHTARTLLHHEHRDDPEHLALDLALPTTSFDHARAVTLTLEPGQVSFHDVFLVHGSEPNRSSRSRRGMTVRFMPTTSVYNHTSASNAAMATLPVFLAAGRDVKIVASTRVDKADVHRCRTPSASVTHYWVRGSYTNSDVTHTCT